MVKTKKRATGDVGEEIVCKYLENKGFSVLERNYLRPWGGELDTVATKDNRVHFIEVKTVTRESVGKNEHRPEDGMHFRKVQRLHRAIQTYLLGHKKLQNIDFQLDLACVYLALDTRRARVEVLENIVL